MRKRQKEEICFLKDETMISFFFCFIGEWSQKVKKKMNEEEEGEWS